jgi:phage-related protein
LKSVSLSDLMRESSTDKNRRFPVANLNLTPDWNAKQKFTQEVLQTPLGDGYHQMSSGGMVPELEEWELTKTGLTLTQVNALVAQFSLASGVDTFYWYPPSPQGYEEYRELWKPRPYFCKMWSRTELGPNVWQFQCTLIREWEDPNS